MKCDSRNRTCLLCIKLNWTRFFALDAIQTAVFLSHYTTDTVYLLKRCWIIIRNSPDITWTARKFKILINRGLCVCVCVFDIDLVLAFKRTFACKSCKYMLHIWCGQHPRCCRTGDPWQNEEEKKKMMDEWEGLTFTGMCWKYKGGKKRWKC